MSPRGPELFRRYEGNPILTAEQWPHTVNAVFNPGATVFEGETLLLVRVEDRTGMSHMAVARSADGLTGWRIDAGATLMPELDKYHEAWGIEDPRITRCGDEYMIVYTGYSLGGPLVCLASTCDFVSFERRGVLMSPEDKDAALFPKQFGGRWALIHRPVPHMVEAKAHIWLSWSPDLRHWGDHSVIVRAREGGWWDANKIGLGPPPLLTEEGWLVLYHGVRQTVGGSVYRLGLALLDTDDPTCVKERSREWIFGPSTDYERAGDVHDVVFPCGWILGEDGDTIRVYYGAADTSVAVAYASLGEVLDFLHTHGSAEP